MGLRIVMLGAPGAGKGTQAKRIAQVYGLPHISTGDIFRENLRNGTDLGRQVQQYMDAGRLVPDDLTCAIVADRLAKDDCRAGYILDGFPRSLPQAEALEKVLADHGTKLDVAVNIDVQDAEIVDRLTARRSCSKCGRIYNLKFDAPKEAGVCDEPACEKAPLIHRRDDQEETIRERLRVYHETTEPIIAFYERAGILETVSGTGRTPDTVFATIEETLAALVAD
ncbi:MAG TPA: adenylate kinase [Candidatus Hydrogenedentes bacterium]|nr:adenylate kinase [Candidatus Hydrogenedentota bacterium]HPG69465.1 adenylate kinase [Candidatus Hydrogenedentota bacterium]